MAFPKKHTTCKDCGWQCKSCEDKSGLHLHVEIENLKQRLLEREHHIVSMETNFLNEAEKFPNGEFSALNEELLTWQEKYSRLYESHKRVQKVNQGLEDKLLRIVDKFETEKNLLTRDLGNVTHRLVEARSKIKQLEDENERYRLDVNLAIQLLQCKPTNFVSQKIDALSPELQQHVRLYVSSKRPEGNCSQTPKPEPKIIKVPIPTFPPTAMVYSLNKTVSGFSDKDESSGNSRQPVDIVSAAIMAKVLEERARERLLTKHCQTCTCSSQVHRGTDCSTQTLDEQLEHALPHSLFSNQGNQGLVRYTDVVATRNSNEFTRSNLGIERNMDNVQESQKSGSNSLRNIRYVSGSSLNFTNSGATTRSIESMKLSDPLLEHSNGNSNGKRFGYGDEGAKPNGDITKTHATKNSDTLSLAKNVVKTSKRVGDMISGTRQTKESVSVQGLDDILWSSLSSLSMSPVSNQVSIEMDSGAFVPASARSRDMLYSKLEDKRLQSVFNKSETMRTRNHESRTFLSDEMNNDISKPSPQKSSPKEPGVESKSFSGAVQRKVRETPGPRACSLRMQAGSGNILLANATCYTPVLYTSRPDAQVHSTRSRSVSASSTDTGPNSSPEI